MSHTSSSARQCGVCTEEIPGGTERVTCPQCQAKFHKICFDNANEDPLTRSCPVCKIQHTKAPEKEDVPCYYCTKKFKRSQLVKAQGKDNTTFLLCQQCIAQAKRDIVEEEQQNQKRLEDQKAMAEEKAKKALEQAEKAKREQDAAKALDQAEKAKREQQAAEKAKRELQAAEKAKKELQAAEKAKKELALKAQEKEDTEKAEKELQEANAQRALQAAAEKEMKEKAARAKEIRDALEAGPSGRSKPSSSSSRAKRDAIDRKISDITQETEALSKVLAESKKAIADLLERRSELSSSTELDSSEDDSFNRTGEWAKKIVSSRRKEVKFTSGTTDAESDEEDDQVYPGFKSKRSSTPKPYLNAKTHTEFLDSLGRNNSIFEKSTSRERTLRHHTSRLTLDESIARQGVSHSLPHFSGNPMEWPEFIHDYVTSTVRCNFSDVENSKRLREALKGDALRLVRTKLMFPEKINESIAMLRLKYGRPDQILDSLVERVNNIPAVEADDLNGIVDLTVAVDDIISILKASGMEEDMRNAKLLRDFVKKLPPVYRVQWGFQRSTNTNIKKFHKWLMELAYVAAEMADTNKTKSKRPQEKPSAYPTSKRSSSEVKRIHHANLKVTSPKSQCVVCARDSHKAHECFVFLRKDGTERWQAVRQHKLCGKCLDVHDYQKCRKRVVCGVKGCTKKHHPLLHCGYEQLSSSTAATPAKNDVPSTSRTNADEAAGSSKAIPPQNVGVHRNSSPTKFRILPVRIYHGDQEKLVYAFLDEGSSVTMIDEDLANELKLNGPTSQLCLQWTNDIVREEASSRVLNVVISNLARDKQYLMKGVRTVKNISLPSQTMTPQETRHFGDKLPIAKYSNVQPKLLIGLPHWYLAQSRDYCEDRASNLIATKSLLGWTIVGRDGNDNVREVNIHDCIQNEDVGKILQQLKRFFSIEYFGVRSPLQPVESEENLKALDLLRKSIRLVSDRYEVGLLWKNPQIALPDSYNMALQRHRCFQRKMSKDPKLQKNIATQIAEYEAKGYIEMLTPQEEQSRNAKTWYLPLFVVTNPNKPEKVRMVWDAAAKVKDVSLNSQLMSGPDLLSPLVDVLRRFRQHPVAITADIKEMFHRVMIREEDRDSQRFLFQKTPHDPVQTYRMRVMTFGATCSPFSAQFVKNFNADKFAKQYPAAVEEVKRNHYVDDFASSFKTQEEAIQIAKQVVDIHMHGGFQLRGFASNISAIPKALGETTNPEVKSLENSSEIGDTKVLGLYWRTSDDTLNFEAKTDRIGQHFFDPTYHPSKREVLKIMMMIYDPLGLIAPFLIRIKTLMQEVWQSGVDWDDKIRTDELREWHTWIEQLKILRITIPRCHGLDASTGSEVELHVFVDASQAAFAAAAYFRMPDKNGRHKCSLVGAKSKVAPLKPLSIPRLELQAAVLGVRLARSIKDGHTLRISQTTYWSDSMNVLGWVRSSARKYKTFVALRIGEILEASDVGEWRYVPTSVNIADDATKAKPHTFDESSRWFKGPEFLELQEDKWPNNPSRNQPPEEEVRRTNVHDAMKESATPKFDNISKWEVLVRAQVWILRTIRFKKPHEPFVMGIFKKEEVEEAEFEIWRTVQKLYYSDEIELLQNGKSVPPTSKIFALTPYLDGNHLLRMRGRLKYARISEDAKHPIIIPNQHRATKLLIECYHRKYQHENNETVVNQLRQKYWIPKMRVTVRAVCRKCFDCKKRRAKPSEPIMADLPVDRVTLSTPFAYVGLDYFGPLEVINHRRREKRWVALFTCLSVRAVHMEIVSSLTSDSAIMCLRRFMAIRGVPCRLWSDNALTFKGANQELIDQINFQEVANMVDGQLDKFDWSFIPPAAPHMGGAWERLVRSVKKTLARVQPMRTPTEEQLSTYLSEVANIINSRPLTYMPQEDGTIEALTPNHFLLQSSRGAKSLGEVPNDGRSLKKMWRSTQLLLDEFWKRWTTEFVPTLNKRAKWQNEEKPLAIGDVGLLWDDHARSSWRLGRVEEIKRADDGQVREITVRTATGTYRRPATRFGMLELKDDEAPTNSGSDSGSSTKGGIVAADNSENPVAFNYESNTTFLNTEVQENVNVIDGKPHLN